MSVICKSCTGDSRICNCKHYEAEDDNACAHCGDQEHKCKCIKCTDCGSVDDVEDGTCADCKAEAEDYRETASNSGRHE